MAFKKYTQPQGLPFTTVAFNVCYKCKQPSIQMTHRTYSCMIRPLMVDVYIKHCINCRLNRHADMS